MFANDGHAQNMVFARLRQHFNKAMRFTVSNGTIQIVKMISADFISNVLFFGILFIKTDPWRLQDR